MNLLEALALVNHAFPEADDPDRYECLAFVFQLFSYRQKRHAELLRSTRKRKQKAAAAAGGDR